MTARHALTPGRNCWRIETADAASVIVDAEGYFRIARQAMLTAKHQILLIGWDFDARIKLVRHPDDGAPAEVGAFIDWLVARTPGLQVHILRWDMGALKTLFRGRTLLTVIRWMFKRRIHLKLDSVHPHGASHHQKIVVIDDCLAFCGGIDMTDDRWDTRAHRDNEPERLNAGGKRYKPWHDATTALSGAVARALGELGRERWARAGGRPIAPPPPVAACWPEDLPADFTEIAVAISRTRPEMPDITPVHGSRRSISTSSRAPSGGSMPKASISPRAASPRRSRGGSRNPTGPRSCCSTRKLRKAGWSRWRWTPPARA